MTFTVISFVFNVLWIVCAWILFPLVFLRLVAIGIGSGHGDNSKPHGSGQHFIQNDGHIYSNRVPKPSGLDSVYATRHNRGAHDIRFISRLLRIWLKTNLRMLPYTAILLA